MSEMQEKLAEVLNSVRGHMRPSDEEERNNLETLPEEERGGRLDALAYGVAERYIEKSGNATLVSAWGRFRNPIAEFLEDNLGPLPMKKPRKRRSKTGRQRRRRGQKKVTA